MFKKFLFIVGVLVGFFAANFAFAEEYSAAGAVEASFQSCVLAHMKSKGFTSLDLETEVANAILDSNATVGYTGAAQYFEQSLQAVKGDCNSMKYPTFK